MVHPFTRMVIKGAIWYQGMYTYRDDQYGWIPELVVLIRAASMTYQETVIVFASYSTRVMLMTCQEEEEVYPLLKNKIMKLVAKP